MREVVRAGDTFTYDPAMDADTARAMWMVPAPGRTVVAVGDDHAVLGTANMYANRAGPGAQAEKRTNGVSRWLEHDA